MFAKKIGMIPIAISASLLVAAMFVFIQASSISSVVSDSSSLKWSGHVCIYKNDQLVECGKNLITNAGKNATRDLLTQFNTSQNQARLNGTWFIDVSTDSTAASVNTVLCPATVNGSGLARSLGTIRYETIESPSLAVGNYSVSNKFTASATVANVQKVCLTNGTGGNPNITFAEDTFTAVTLNNGDTINITWFIGVS